MPSSLVTDWKCVATAGPTVDGRFIKAEWLTDMAATYDPAVYTAKIWLDHMRYESYGSVQALKVEELGDAVKLFAKIAPNRSLLQMNQVWEQCLHFSIEPTENFAQTGKCYLTGLGMTDSPASLGTDEMRFASIAGRDYTSRLPGEQVPDLSKEFTDDEERFARGFFQKLSRFFKDEHNNETGDDPMNKEQFDAVKGTLEATQQAVTTLAGSMQTFMETFKTPPAGGDGAGGDGQGGGEATKPAETDQFAVLQASVTSMTDAFTAMTQRMEKAAPGTFAKENHGAADDQDGLY